MNKPTSIYLDLIRFLAASIVFFVHANYNRFTGGLPFLWRLENLGNDAVMVFFVLSGFVIAYVSSEKEKTLRDYFASRFARLYSVAIPGLILTVILDWFGSKIDHSVYSGWWFQADNPIWRLLANLFFFNELWFNSIRPFSNGPYWSLGYEFWYYVLFACFQYLRGVFRIFAGFLICILIGPKILLLFPIWLMGVFAYSVIKNHSISLTTGWIFFLTSIMAYLFFRLGGYPQALLDWTTKNLGESVIEELGWSKHFLSSYILGVLITIHFIGIAVISRTVSPILVIVELPIRYFAGFTFALYLFHYPCLMFFTALSSKLNITGLRISFILGGTILVVWILGTITENRKSLIRSRLLQTYDLAVAKFSFTGKS